MDEPRDSSLTVQVALAEFSILESEVAGRSSSQAALLNLNLTAVAAVGGFIFAQNAPDQLALILAFICPALAFTWLDHARVIANIGRYVSASLWPYIREQLGTSSIPLREDWVRKEEERKLSYLTFHAPLFAVFNAPPIVALVSTFPTQATSGPWAIWGLGATCTGASLLYWLLIFLNPAIGTYLGPPRHAVPAQESARAMRPR